MQQLLDYDAERVDLSGLTDLILAQPLLGSTIKTEGNESDPYAVLSIINVKQHRLHVAVETLIQYLLERSQTDAAFTDALQPLLAADTKAEVGLILSARIMNLPVQTIPPTYTMLLDEIKWAVDDNEDYRFSHYLLLSKSYTEVVSVLDQEDQQTSKRKKKIGKANPETFYFHAEDEIMEKFAVARTTYPFQKHPGPGAADSRRAFQDEGIDPQGHLILFEAKQFELAVKALSSALAGD